MSAGSSADAAGQIVLAHHPLITALPFVVPAVILVGLIIAIVVRDRRGDGSEEPPA